MLGTMIDLYFWPTPNGLKPLLFLEEAALPHKIVPVDIGAGEQFAADYLVISPNNKMPAIVDHAPAAGGEPVSVFESGAILLYLAEKTGRFLPTTLRGRVTVLEWLFWQVGGLGPMAGQNHHFTHYAPEPIPYAIERYVKETSRLYAVLNRRLEGRSFIADEYSIADMAAYPWIVPHALQGQKLEDFPHLERWFNTISARPATRAAYIQGRRIRPDAPLSDAEKKILFDQSSSTVR
jgi:GST-like protein